MTGTRRATLRRAGFAVVVGLVVAACGSAVHSQPVANLDTYDGDVAPVIEQDPTTIGLADSDLYGLPLDRISKAVSLMKASGIGTVRILLPWVAVEQTRGDYDWSLVDRIVDAVSAQHMSVLATLNSTPQWAVAPGAPPLSGHPQSAADYGRFAGRVANRYRGKISAYEIWNEPNAQSFFAPAPDPAEYVALLKAAYPAIKAVDPAAVVVTGGLGPIVDFGSMAFDAVNFVRGMYAAGAKPYFDAIGYHPYQYTMKFSEGGHHPDSPINQLSGIREVMLANGDAAKKVWATEYGEPSSVSGDAGQADYLDDMLANWRRLPYAGPVYVYTMRDRDSSSSSADDTLGIYRSDGTAKPVREVVKARAEQRRSYTPPANSPPR